MKRRLPAGSGRLRAAALPPTFVAPGSPDRSYYGRMAWLDSFFDSFHRHRPVDATFFGIHENDHRLPDLSEDGAGDQLAEMRALLEAAPADRAARPAAFARDPAALPVGAPLTAEAIDTRLARGFLRIQIAEVESDRFWRGNPCVYTGEAVFGAMSLFLSDHAPFGERVEAATERLARVADLLAQGRANVRRSRPAWTERALRECEGARLFLTEGIDLLRRGQGAAGERLARAGAHAAAAFAEFRHYLETELRRRSDLEYGCGEEMLELFLRDGHFLEQGANTILQEAQSRLADWQSDLERRAGALGGRDRSDVLDRLASLHPPAEHFHARFQETWTAMRTAAESHELLSWPEFPIRFVPQPAWARAAAPHLYFLPYRAPAAFRRPPVHSLLVPPLDAAQSPSAQEAVLRANNDSVIKLNYIIHHAGIGHHVQNWHAYRSASRIGRVAAVDCALRIAMFCGGTMAEGWACYATDLMAEIGAFTPLEEFAHALTNLRMCARAIVDVKLHTHDFTFDEAITYYETTVGMSHDAATAEAVKNSMFPGTALMYFVGTEAIHALRREMRALRGDRFSLRAFHDEFLSWGSIPVRLIGDAMRRGAQRAE